MEGREETTAGYLVIYGDVCAKLLPFEGRSVNAGGSAEAEAALSWDAHELFVPKRVTPSPGVSISMYVYVCLFLKACPRV